MVQQQPHEQTLRQRLRDALLSRRPQSDPRAGEALHEDKVRRPLR